MQFSTIFSAVSILSVATSSAVPYTGAKSGLSLRQSSTTPINTTTLYLGACLSVGSCYYDGETTGCYTPACGNSTMLGSVCSCNVDVQAALSVQMNKGKKMWPIKCPY